MSRTNTTHLPTPVTEREQFLLDVLTTAVEGGINYWADIEVYRWQAGPKSAKVVVREEDCGDWHTVTIASLRRALGALRRAKLTAPSTDARLLGVAREDALRILEISATNGREEVADASDSEIIFQIACFGQVVYG